MSAHDQVAGAIASMLADVASDEGLPEAPLERLLQMAHDLAEQVDLGRTQKPGTWAAALYYAFARIQFAALTQAEAAAAFGVSAQSVTAKFKQVDEALELLVFDPRYVLESERPAALNELESLMGGITFGSGFRGFGENDQAQDATFDGWDRFHAGDAAGAREHFEQALALDPKQVDALNGLAALSEDAADAERIYRLAVAAGHAVLGSDHPDAYMWWGEIETRPYMRARCGVAGTLSAQDRHREAAAEYEALLALNPNDNQGIRYAIGPEYLRAGDAAAAVRAYDAYTRDYPDDTAEPDHAVLHGLALWAGGRREDAVRAWGRALAGNLYVIPAVLGAPLPAADLWHGSNYAEPDAGPSHLDAFGALWDQHPDARAALGRFWHDADVQARVAQQVDVGQAMRRLSDARRAGAEHDDTAWRALAADRWAERGALVSDATIQRVIRP